jgi:signal transduction histidine kinase
VSVTISSIRPRSLRAQIYLCAVAAFLIIGFIVTVVAVTIVNRMKNRLVEQSITLVRDSGEELADQLSALLQQAGATSFSELAEPERRQARDMINRFARQTNALTLFTLQEDNRVAYLIDRGGAQAGPLAPQPPMPGDVPPGVDLEHFQPPTTGDNQPVAITLQPTRPGGSNPTLRVFFLLSPKRVESSLKPTSQAITRVSLILVGILLVLLAAAITSLARVLSHLMTVHDESARLDRLAYVGTLAAGLAHEIRNPLNAMSINLDLLAEDLGTDSAAAPESRKLVSSVKSEITHLNKTVENFLAFARPPRPAHETVDLGKSMREAVIAVGPELESRGIRCHVGELPDGAPVEVDPTTLHQALTNILLNAMQAMDKRERHITVSGQQDGHRADLTIADNGKGIPPDHLDHIFEVFYTTKADGSGLGLPTAKRVIEDAEGSITVDSLAGQGTQVTITLPLARRRRWL